MKLGIMQPYFFPYIGYFQLIAATDVFILYGNVTFRKRSWITRNRLMDKGSGEPFYINVPVKKSSSNKLIRDIEINHSIPWQKKLLDLISYNYKKAEFFEENFEYVKALILFQSPTLHDYNSRILLELCSYLDISTSVLSDTCKESFLNIENELNIKSLQNNLNNKTQRIISLCQHIGAEHYINAPGGSTLYSKSDFAKLGVQLNYLQPSNSTYHQFKHPFQNYLSILDLLFHMGKVNSIAEIGKFSLI